jgi:hypothetical protein
VPEEDNLRLLKVFIRVREHLVERVEKELDRVPEGVVHLAHGRPNKKQPRPDDELHKVLDAREALLNRVLVLLGRDVVGEVAQTGEKAPEETLIRLRNKKTCNFEKLTCRPALR